MDISQAPSSLLDALEQHLASLEGKKGSAANTPTQSARYVDYNSYKYLKSIIFKIGLNFTNSKEYFAIYLLIILKGKI